jgi:parallel beta-helix repeat protein
MPAYRYTFISHAHADNALCDPIAAAFARLGIPHYYDRANPQIGHDLGESLERELQDAQALIVLASPRSLASPWVREEINIFFTLMMREPTRMLIPVKVAPCDLPPRLEARWWVDAMNRPTNDVAAELARALEQGAATWPAQPAPSAQATGYTRTVDWRHGADHTSITDAIRAARPGERILVRRGVYEGGLILDKPLEIVGDGQPGDVEVLASGSDVILFKATQGRVANLTLRQTGGGKWFCVDITSGRLELEDCDISSQSLACVAVHESADPRVRRCHIHDGTAGGVYVFSKGQGIFEDCDIFANALAGVEVKTGAAPTVRRCRIHDGKQGGVFVNDEGQGVFEDCEIFANTYAGVEVKTGGVPTVRKCRIHDGRGAGVYVHDQGQGLFEDCDVTANANSGIQVKTGSSPTVRRCRIHDGQSAGVFINEQGQGLFEDCEIFANAFGGVSIQSEGNPTVRRCRIHDGKQSGVLVNDQGQGLLEDCDIVSNARAGIEVRTGGTPTVRKCRINKNGYEAIWVHEEGGGVYEQNDLRENTKGAWDIESDSASKVARRGNTE